MFRRTNRAGFLAAAVAGLAALPYASVWRHAFVSWDDNTYVYDNPVVREGLRLQGIVWAFGSLHAANWHPLTWLSHMTDVSLFGLDPSGHHLVSVAIHVLNAVALFFALRAMTHEDEASGWVAALFAVHPLRVESVAWVAERKDVLSSLFFMLTLIVYVRWVRRGGLALRLGMIGLYAAGLLAKPMLVTLPALLLLLDLWPLGRWRLAAADGSAARRLGLARLVVEKWPLVCLASTSAFVTLFAQRAGGSMSGLTEIPLAARIANAITSLASYLGSTLWPVNLACFYPHPAILFPRDPAITWQTIVAAAALVGLAAFAFNERHRRPWWWIGLGWSLIGLLPVLGIVQVGMQSRADRYTYLPTIGLYLALVWSLRRWSTAVPVRRIAWRLASGVVVMTLVVLSTRQAQTWRDSQTLFEHARSVTQRRLGADLNYVALNNLGNLDLAAGRLAAAREAYQQALVAHPGYARAWSNLGLVHEREQRPAEAIAAWREALRLDPAYASAHNHLGAALSRAGDDTVARQHLERALALDPDHAEAHNNLGVLLERRGELAQAQAHFAATVRLQPRFAEARNNLGLVLLRMNDLDRAAEHFEAALSLRPDYVVALNNIGIVRARQGRMHEALAHFQTALRLDPNHRGARDNLARARASLGQPPG